MRMWWAILPESSVIRGYIETLLGLPWDKMSRDNRDLKQGPADPGGGSLRPGQGKGADPGVSGGPSGDQQGRSPILCLVGPPGTGKTSISKSIAKALNKTYVRISLGGVRDEAEIRGHRRTYIGAMPGRIAAGLKQAGVKNPLMLLDEIDKTSSDYKGDIASSLLEVLDPEENHAFSDHYVEVPIDLSEVLFIATANDVQTIPRPLLDRMELIEITSYTENEKQHIAKEHLIPKQIRANGLKKKGTAADHGRGDRRDHHQVYQGGRRPVSGAPDRADLPQGGPEDPGRRVKRSLLLRRKTWRISWAEDATASIWPTRSRRSASSAAWPGRRWAA